MALKPESSVNSLRSRSGLSSSCTCDKPFFRKCLTGVYRVPAGEYSAAGEASCGSVRSGRTSAAPSC